MSTRSGRRKTLEKGEEKEKDSVVRSSCYCLSHRTIGKELLCRGCGAWFHYECLYHISLRQIGRLPFRVSYSFACRSCSKIGREQYECTTVHQKHMCVTALANLTAKELHAKKKTNNSHEAGTVFFKIDEVLDFMRENWKRLTTEEPIQDRKEHKLRSMEALGNSALFKIDSVDPERFALNIALTEVSPTHPALKIDDEAQGPAAVDLVRFGLHEPEIKIEDDSDEDMTEEPIQGSSKSPVGGGFKMDHLPMRRAISMLPFKRFDQVSSNDDKATQRLAFDVGLLNLRSAPKLELIKEEQEEEPIQGGSKYSDFCGFKMPFKKRLEGGGGVPVHTKPIKIIHKRPMSVIPQRRDPLGRFEATSKNIVKKTSSIPKVIFKKNATKVRPVDSPRPGPTTRAAWKQATALQSAPQPVENKAKGVMQRAKSHKPVLKQQPTKKIEAKKALQCAPQPVEKKAIGVMQRAKSHKPILKQQPTKKIETKKALQSAPQPVENKTKGVMQRAKSHKTILKQQPAKKIEAKKPPKAVTFNLSPSKEKKRKASPLWGKSGNAITRNLSSTKKKKGSSEKNVVPFSKESSIYFAIEKDPHAEITDYNNQDYRVVVPLEVKISPNDRAEELKVSADGLTVSGFEGYRIARATHGVKFGTWYYEVEFVEQTEESCVRIGWSREESPVQCTLGFSKYSYSWRSDKGTKFHDAKGYSYKRGGYKEGDILGMLIHLPIDQFHPNLPSKDYLPPSRKNSYLCGQRFKFFRRDCRYFRPLPDDFEPFPGSRIEFFLNGVSCGVAFENIYRGLYFPAVALYGYNRSPALRFHFGDSIKYLPAGARRFDERAIELPVEQTLSDVIFLASNDKDYDEADY